MIKNYIINLDRDVERMEHMRTRFDELGLTFERISAVDGRLMSEKEFAAFTEVRKRKNGLWRRGEAGCFLSHYTVWEKIAQGAETHATIFEDDMHISQSIKEVLSDTALLPEDCDILRLETSTNRLLLDKEVKRKVGGRLIQRLRSTSWCAGAYIISRACAKKLTSLSPIHHNLVDYFLFSFEGSSIAQGLALYQMSPALATQDKYIEKQEKVLGFDSNIEGMMPSIFTRKVIRQLKKITPLALYRTAKGYKRISFQL